MGTRITLYSERSLAVISLLCERFSEWNDVLEYFASVLLNCLHADHDCSPMRLLLVSLHYSLQHIISWVI